MTDPQSLSVSRVARAGTPTHEFLQQAESDGKPGISMAELHARIEQGNFPQGMTQAKVNAVATTFANTLAPTGEHGVAVSSRASVVIPKGPSTIQESTGAWAASWVAGRTFTNMEIKNGKTVVGSVQREYRMDSGRKTLHDLVAPTLVLKDAQGNVVARAIPKIFDFRVVIKVYDGSANPDTDAPFATIRQEWGDFFSGGLQRALAGKTFYSKYAIEDANQQVVAESEKVDVFAPNFALSTAAGEQGTLSKPWFDMGGNSWTMNAHGDAPVDRRVYAFIASYKTIANAAKRSEAFWEIVGAVAESASE